MLGFRFGHWAVNDRPDRVLASTAPPTVPITTAPGLKERARQASSAPPISAAAATLTGVPSRLVINDAS